MSNFGKDQSKFKLLIYLKNGSSMIFYSLVNEEKKGDEVAIRGMKRRLLDGKFKNKYQTAIFYDRYADKIVQKYINGKMEVAL